MRTLCAQAPAGHTKLTGSEHTHENEFQTVENLKQNIRTSVRTSNRSRGDSAAEITASGSVCDCMCCSRTSAVFCWFLLSS